MSRNLPRPPIAQKQDKSGRVRSARSATRFGQTPLSAEVPSGAPQLRTAFARHLQTRLNVSSVASFQ
jgi:hypothetical protein